MFTARFIINIYVCVQIHVEYLYISIHVSMPMFQTYIYHTCMCVRVKCVNVMILYRLITFYEYVFPIRYIFCPVI